MNRNAIRLLIAAAGLAAAGAAWAQKTQLLVYTALETDQLKAYEQGFYREVPDVEIRWVRDSTGVITAKLLAEKANPQADVIFGVAASSLALLDTNGMLEPYAPINLDAEISGSDVALAWDYRSRLATGTNPATHGESTLSFEIDIMDGSTVKRTLTATTNSKTYLSADITTDFGGQPSSEPMNYTLNQR